MAKKRPNPVGPCAISDDQWLFSTRLQAIALVRHKAHLDRSQCRLWVLSCLPLRCRPACRHCCRCAAGLAAA